jgi:hypothetical protein
MAPHRLLRPLHSNRQPMPLQPLETKSSAASGPRHGSVQPTGGAAQPRRRLAHGRIRMHRSSARRPALYGCAGTLRGAAAARRATVAGGSCRAFHLDSAAVELRAVESHGRRCGGLVRLRQWAMARHAARWWLERRRHRPTWDSPGLGGKAQLGRNSLSGKGAEREEAKWGRPTWESPARQEQPKRQRGRADHFDERGAVELAAVLVLEPLDVRDARERLHLIPVMPGPAW